MASSAVMYGGHLSKALAVRAFVKFKALALDPAHHNIIAVSV